MPRPFVRSLVVLDSVDSTNDEARRLAASGAEEGTVVIAECQTAGRGRLGRRWHSPPGLGLYVSILLRPRRPASELPRWAIAAAAAGCLAIRDAGAAGARVEWPNDIVWRGLKIGGTLVEARGSGGAPSDLVVGTGLNLSHGEADFPDEIRGRAASLEMAAPRGPARRETIAASFLTRLADLSAELAAGVFERTRRSWLELAPGATGHAVRVADGGGAGEYRGRTRGIDDTGALRVETDDGSVRVVRATGTVVWLEG